MRKVILIKDSEKIFNKIKEIETLMARKVRNINSTFQNEMILDFSEAVNIIHTNLNEIDELKNKIAKLSRDFIKLNTVESTSDEYIEFLNYLSNE